MKITKDKRTNVYRVTMRTAEGETRSISTGKKNLDEAKAMVKQSKILEIENAARAGKMTAQAVSLIMTGKKMTVEQSIEKFTQWLKNIGSSPITVHNQTITITSWVEGMKIGHLAPAMVTEAHITPWLESKGHKVSTKAMILANIRNWFKFCAGEGWIVRNPAALVRLQIGSMTHEQKEPKGKQCFTNAEIDWLLQETEPGSFWHTAIAIGRFTGLRMGDICKLEWASLNGKGVIEVWTDKRDKKVSLPLTEQRLINAISAVAYQDDRFMFPKEASEFSILVPNKRTAMCNYFRRLCERHDIMGKTFHELRHTYVTEELKAGRTIEHIATAVGHSNVKTTWGYAH